jgi:hypothetical protein
MGERIVPSANYDLFEQAMRTRKQIVCMYDGHSRELCPIILGHSQGQEKALTYQVGGESKSGLSRAGDCVACSYQKSLMLNSEMDHGWWAPATLSHKAAYRS